MRIVVVGAGSLGLLYAGKVAAVHKPFVITHSEEQAMALSKKGINIIDLTGQGQVVEYPSHQVSSYYFDQIRSSKSRMNQIIEIDWIFLFVKQFHLDGPLIASLTQMMNNNKTAKLLCFQNGIGHLEKLAATLPQHRLYVAITTEGARKRAAEAVEHTGKGITWIGQVASSAKSMTKDEKKLLFTLQAAGFDIHLSKEMERFIWDKLLINAVINPLTAVHCVRNGQLLASDFLLGSMKRLYQEAVAVASKLNKPLSPQLWERMIDVCERTANNHSSMLQDLMNGNRTEIDWINGSLIRMAAEINQDVPSHVALYQHIKQLESRT